MTWRIIVLFVLFATLLTIVVGLLTKTGKLPIQHRLVFSDAGQRFMRVWIQLAISLGIVLPGIAWVVWLKHPQPHQILNLYLVVLLIQIVTEQIASSIGISSLVVTIGTVYTMFRLWQLWQGQQLLDQVVWSSFNQNLMLGLLCLLGLFWFSNLIMLLTLGWSSILRRD